MDVSSTSPALWKRTVRIFGSEQKAVRWLHTTFLRGKKKTPSELMPRVHRVISLLKRWLMGTHQGAVSHMDNLIETGQVREIVSRTGERGRPCIEYECC